MKCPHCSLFNPDAALRCACGYDFGSGQMKASYLAQVAQAEGQMNDPQRTPVGIGISRTSLNIRALIGMFIFGWLMKMNYDDLGERGFGWTFLIAIAFVFAIGREVEPGFFIVGVVIYIAAWIHTNVLLTNRERQVREQRAAGSGT